MAVFFLEKRLLLPPFPAQSKLWSTSLRGLLSSLLLLAFGSQLHAQGLQRTMPQPDGVVRALAASGDTLYIGGDFRSISQPGRAANYLGLYDTLTRSVNGSRPVPNGPVNAVLADGQNGLLVAGQFRNIGDSACYSIAWLDSNGVPRPNLRNFGVSGQVNSLVRIGDTLYLGGNFTQAGSNLQFTGGFPEFDSSGALLRRLPKPNFPAKAIISDGQGGWILAGPFTNIDGQPRQGLARIRPDGRLLESWAPAIQGEARALLLVGDTLFVGGSIAAINGQARGNLAALRFSTGAPLSWAPLCNRSVEALAFSNNLLVVGGNFTQIDNSQRNRLAAYNYPSLLPSSLGTALDSTVSVLRFHQGFLYLGGDFSTAAGLPRRGLAVFDQNFLFPTTATAQLNGSVRSISIDAQGRLTVGGSFTQAGGQMRTNLARFDGPQLNLLPWTVTLTGRIDWVGHWRNRILVSGALDSLQGQPLSTALLALDSITAQPDTSMLNVPAIPTALAVAGGNFTYLSNGEFNGGEVVSHLAAVDLNSGQMLPWKPLADLPVNTLLAQGRRLFVGGRFVRISMFLSRGLAELNPSTGLVIPGLPTPNGEVRALATHDTLLLVGGNFSSFSNQARTHFGAVNLGSKTLNSLSLTLDANIGALHTDQAGNLYLGGKFSLVNGQNRRGLARISLQNGQLTSFTLPLSVGSEILAFAEDSLRLYVGGDFLSINTGLRPFLAAIRKNTASLEPRMLMATASIRAFAWSNGKLAIGGDATAIGSEVRPGIAAVSINNGQVLPWMPQAEEWVGYGSNGLSRRIEALLIQGNRLLIGGNFSLSSPISAQHFTAFDLATGQAINALPQFSAEVRGLTLHNGLVWVAGAFNSLNYQGNPISRSGIAALNPGNLSPNNWTPSGFPAQLLSVKGLNATEIMVAGTTIGAFNTTTGSYRSYGFLGGVGRKVEVAGAAVIAGGLFNGSSRLGLQMKLAPNQQNLNAMDLGPAPALNPLSEGVYAMEIANGLVYVGGQFTQVNGQLQPNMAVFNLVNGGQIAYNPVPDSAVLSLIFHQNTLYCGGRFNQIFGQTAPRLAALRTAFPVAQQVVTEEAEWQRVWPNPARRHLYWNKLDSVEGDPAVLLYDLQGRLMAATTYRQMSLELPALKAGIYLLKIEGISLKSFKVVVE